MNISKAFLVFLFGLTVILTGCVDLSGARLTPERKTNFLSPPPPIKRTQRSKSEGEVHTMLGGLGLFSVGMNELRDDIAKQYKHVSAYSNLWYNAGDVSRSIEAYYVQHQRHRPIILMGHSLGANEQIKVARKLEAAGIPVDLLVTVDAVSQSIIPSNVKYALNVYKPGYVPMFSGLKIKAVNPNRTFIENINVDDLEAIRVNHFTIDKDKKLQALILNRVQKVFAHANSKKA